MTTTVREIIVNRDGLIKAQLRVSLARRGVDPELIDAALNEALRKAHREWCGYIKNKSYESVRKALAKRIKP